MDASIAADVLNEVSDMCCRSLRRGTFLDYSIHALVILSLELTRIGDVLFFSDGL